MVLKMYEKQRNIHYYSSGYNSPTIQRRLKEDIVTASQVAMWKFLRVYLEIRSLAKKEI